jgi:hypothetical protein
MMSISIWMLPDTMKNEAQQEGSCLFHCWRRQTMSMADKPLHYSLAFSSFVLGCQIWTSGNDA